MAFNKSLIAFAVGGLLGLGAIAHLFAQQTAPAPTTTTAPTTQPVDLAALGKRNIRVHDPSTIVKCGNEYWVFNTGNGLNSYHSPDLLNWTRAGRVITEMPKWVTDVVPNQTGSYWAPDILFHNNQYFLYYAVSRFGQRTSAIGLATNPTLDPAAKNYHWSDQGIIIQTNNDNDFNAIDPGITEGDSGSLWLVFGSYWSGIKLIQLDPATGKRIAPDSPIHALAYNRSIEASSIYHHGDAYYLFVNWGRCCQGVNSTYNIRIGRSQQITGPYLDKDGVDMAKGGGTLFLGTTGAFIGPGHAGILADGDKFWLSCHFYDGTQNGTSVLALRPLTWAADGWPVLHDNPAP